MNSRRILCILTLLMTLWGVDEAIMFASLAESSELYTNKFDFSLEFTPTTSGIGYAQGNVTAILTKAGGFSGTSGHYTYYMADEEKNSWDLQLDENGIGTVDDVSDLKPSGYYCYVPFQPSVIVTRSDSAPYYPINVSIGTIDFDGPGSYDLGEWYFTAYRGNHIPDPNKKFDSYESSCKKISFTCTVDDECKMTISGNPVDIHSGEKKEFSSDLYLSTHNCQWSFSRSYRSQESKRTLLGFNWESNWERCLFMDDTNQNIGPDGIFQTKGGDRVVDCLEGPTVKDADDDNFIPAMYDPDNTDPTIPHLPVYPRGKPYWVNLPEVNGSVKYILSPAPTGFVANRTIYHYKGWGTGFPYYYVDGDYVSPQGGDSRLITEWAPNQTDRFIYLHSSDGTVDEYYGFHDAPLLTDGKLRSTTDAAGNKTFLSYDGFGRVNKFYLTPSGSTEQILVATLTYYDYEDLAAYTDGATSASANLLKTVTDLYGREVNYAYDREGNLNSVNVFGRETRYAYSSKTEHPTYPALWHNLTKVFGPREVEANPDNPSPSKKIAYGSTGMDYDRVTSETLYVLDDQGSTITQNTETFEYYKYDDDGFEASYYNFDGDEATNTSTEHGLNRAPLMTRHTKANGERTDYFFNYYGQAVRTIHYTKSGDTYSVAGKSEKYVDLHGRTTKSQNQDGTEGTSTYFSLSSMYGLERTMLKKAASSTQASCGCSGGGSESFTTDYRYEPLTGDWNEKTEDGEKKVRTTRIFDYQEMSFAEATAFLASQLFNENDLGTTQTEAVEDLLAAAMYTATNDVNTSCGLGDVNGDGVTVQPRGNVLKEIVEEQTGSTWTKLSESIWVYDTHGQLVREINQEGVCTLYEYDDDGWMIRRVEDADYTGRPTTNPLTGQPMETPIASEWIYQYDERGNKTAQRDPRGVWSEFSYNAWDELLQSVIASDIDLDLYDTDLAALDSDAPRPVSYRLTSSNDYDANGNMIATHMEDRGQSTGCGETVDRLMTYDNFGRKLTDRQEISEGTYALTQYYYDPSDRPVLTVHPTGEADFTEYDNMGRMVRTIRGLKTLTEDQIATIAGGTGITLSCSLADGQMITRNVYETEKNRLYATDVLNAAGTVQRRTRYDYYDSTGQRAKQWIENDPQGTIMGWKYDQNGRMTKNSTYVLIGGVTTQTLECTHYAYDALGRQRQVNRQLFPQDYADFTPTLLSSEGGLTVSQIGSGWLPEDATASDRWIADHTVYDALGRVVSRIADDLTSTTYEYDALGRVKKTVAPDGTSAQNWYDANGNVIQTTRSVPVAGGDPQEYVTVMYYDSLNRPVTQVTRAASGAWGASDWRYNALGQMCAQADANGPAAQSVARTFHTRDGLAQTLVCNALGNATLYAYDGAGRKVRQVRVLTPTSQGNARENGDWMQTHKQFAASIYPFLFTPDPAQGGGDGLITTQYEYDASGRMSALTDDNLHRTRWTYDAAGRRVSETKGIIVSAAGAEDSSSATTLHYSYNADGTLASMTKEDGVVLYYKYDIAGRRLGVYSDEARTVALQTFVADALGRTVTSCDQNTAAGALAAAVTVQRRYDSLGRTLMESLQIGSGAAVRALETSFNSNYKWKQKYPGGRVIACDYDHGRLETVSDVDGAGDPVTPAIAQYAYQGGRVCERTMGNGVNLEVTFNEAGYPATWRHRRASDSAVLIGFDNYYDAAGNKTMRVATHDANDTQRYAYDSDNRLTAFSRGDAAVTSGVPDLCSAPADTWASATQAQFWDLDGLGNWVQTVAKVNGQSTTVNRTADNFNAYTQVDSVSYSYDDNGNLTYDGEKTFAWDKFNRLVTVADTTGILVTYLYDSNRRRVKKIFPTGSEFSNVEYAYTGWQIAAEYADAGTYPQRQYVYGNYIDEPLIMDVNEDNDASCYILDGTVDTTDSRYYYHQDTLYSVCGLTTVADSKLIEAVEYDAYGHFRVLSDANGITSFTNYDDDDWKGKGPSSVANTFTHTGREFDQETGLWNFRNRYKQERFVSRDPAGYVGGINPYEMCASNAVNLDSVVTRSAL